MFDIAVSKLALIGVVALVVIGPEKLPRVARTAGALLGKAQRYVNDVKAEVNRTMELDELRKMKETVEGAARDVESAINTQSRALHRELSSLEKLGSNAEEAGSQAAPGLGAKTQPADESSAYFSDIERHSVPTEYVSARKNWRTRRTAVPQWYKARSGMRTRVQSNAAKMARRHAGRQADDGARR